MGELGGTSETATSSSWEWRVLGSTWLVLKRQSTSSGIRACLEDHTVGTQLSANRHSRALPEVRVGAA